MTKRERKYFNRKWLEKYINKLTNEIPPYIYAIRESF